MKNFNVVEPDPAALIQSMRSVGYDLATALADIIDNSVTAKAGNVYIRAAWDGSESSLLIIDDGDGMDEDSLVEAMRPGTTKAAGDRNSEDLGRFGLGLKTASFSQCKKLTVVSKASPRNALVARQWDLDYVRDEKEWRLIEPDINSILPAAVSELANYESGTVVIWENMDRWVGGMSRESERDRRKFLEDVSHIEKHISMIFHRYIQQPNPVHFYVNGNKVKAWDPFMSKESFTQILPRETVTSAGNQVTIQPYVLPHHSNISEEVHDSAAGIRGWNSHQGFYLYRNKRMLMAGDWLGLGFQKEEHYKLARIQIDLPNTLDSNWSLDIKKSKITVPVEIREDLKRIAKLTRAKASEVYRYRGKMAARTMSDSIHFTWERRVNRGKISYRINRTSPLVKALLDAPDRKKVNVVLDLIEETLPIDTIIVDRNTAPSAHEAGYEGADEASIRTALADVFDILVSNGRSATEAKEILRYMEPFNSDPKTIALIEELR